MNTTTRMLLIACLSLPLLAACNNGADEETTVVAAPMTAPTGTDEEQWGAYLVDVVQRNIGDATSTYVYTLPAENDPDFQGYYDRQLEKASGDVARGGVEGTLLAYGSPSSAKSADLAIAAFANAEPASMEGVRILFIGSPADSERVAAAVAPSGAQYVFVEAK